MMKLMNNLEVTVKICLFTVEIVQSLEKKKHCIFALETKRIANFYLLFEVLGYLDWS